MLNQSGHLNWKKAASSHLEVSVVRTSESGNHRATDGSLLESCFSINEGLPVCPAQAQLTGMSRPPLRTGRNDAPVKAVNEFFSCFAGNTAAFLFFPDIDSLLASYRIVPNSGNHNDERGMSSSNQTHRQQDHNNDISVAPAGSAIYRQSYHLPVRYAGADCRVDGNGSAAYCSGVL
jgi:hypothetical protein